MPSYTERELEALASYRAYVEQRTRCERGDAPWSTVADWFTRHRLAASRPHFMRRLTDARALEAIVLTNPREADGVDPGVEQVLLDVRMHDPAPVLALDEHPDRGDVAWITVVWSRPPNSLPIFGSDASVSSRERYIAT